MIDIEKLEELDIKFELFKEKMGSTDHPLTRDTLDFLDKHRPNKAFQYWALVMLQRELERAHTEDLASQIWDLEGRINELLGRGAAVIKERDELRAKSSAVPEGFVLVPKAESTGLTDKNGKSIFVGSVVEFVGGCRDFLDLSGHGSSKYIVNKGDKMIVRKLKSGYTLSLPWIDCNTPSRIGNLGNYEFWNLHRDFVVIEAQEQSS